MHPSHLRVATLLLVLLSVFIACDRTLPTASPPARLSLQPMVLTPVVRERVMGRLSSVARHLVIALRDSAMRAELVNAMKRQEATHPGLDLHDCAQGTTQRLLETGERNGGTKAAEICAVLATLPGVVLYMAPEQLAKWDATVIPSVTAIEDVSGGRAGPKQAYRSPDRMIDISDPSFKGPLLVVLPYVHAARLNSIAFSPPKLVTRVGPRSLPPLGSRGIGPPVPDYARRDSSGRLR